MINKGSLLPIGSFEEIGGHKGYCLASMVDILSCVLTICILYLHIYAMPLHIYAYAKGGK